MRFVLIRLPRKFPDDHREFKVDSHQVGGLMGGNKEMDLTNP